LKERKWSTFWALPVALLVVGVTVVGCGSSSGGTQSGTEAASKSGSGGSSGSSAADVAAAKQAIAQFIGKPGPFPVTEPLKQVPTGAKVASVWCGTPVCALVQETIKEAAQTMGLNLSEVKAGSSASAVSSAFDSAIAGEPEGVIAGAIDIQLFQRQLKELQEKETPIATAGLVEAEEYGLIPSVDSKQEFERSGILMADYVIAEYGPESKVVFYTVPELAFMGTLESSFDEELASKCPSCESRTVPITEESIGSTAPSHVVSDLQANTETTVAVFGTDEIEIGLPSALKSAGISVQTLGYGATPTNLQYLKEGKEGAVLANDPVLIGWTLIDEMGRLISGQKLQGEEAEGLQPIQFLRQEDVTFDPTKGWLSYPDFKERFEKLWGVGG
jgi:ribose transport system substrate-binding protein